MNFTQMYESFQALENPSFWQHIYMRFYRAWFEGDRWMQYFEGLGTTVLVTILALLIGVAKGNTALLDAINSAMDELKADGTFQAIVDKYITAE